MTIEVVTTALIQSIHITIADTDQLDAYTALSLIVYPSQTKSPPLVLDHLINLCRFNVALSGKGIPHEDTNASGSLVTEAFALLGQSDFF